MIGGTEFQSSLGLLPLVSAQHIDRERREGHHPPTAFRLRSLEPEGLLGMLNRAIYGQTSSLQIDIAPSKAKKLSPA